MFSRVHIDKGEAAAGYISSPATVDTCNWDYYPDDINHCTKSMYHENGLCFYELQMAMC